ncbi:MAG: hypothetical protein ABI193_05145 [Minicystis sp.]
MRDFQATIPGRLRAVSLGSKLLYTAFAIAALAGLLVSWKLYGAAVGEAGPAVYYSGAEVQRAPEKATPDDGPAIELAPENKPSRPITAQMPERKLLEVTHFHLFTIPVYVLILAHLWLLTKLPEWVQHTGVVLAVVTSALHIVAPWLLRASPGAAVLMPISGISMLLTLGAMALISTIDMWLPQPPVAASLAEFRKRKEAEKSTPPKG